MESEVLHRNKSLEKPYCLFRKLLNWVILPLLLLHPQREDCIAKDKRKSVLRNVKKLIRFFSKAFTASIIDHHLGRQWLLAKKQLTANDNSGRVNDSQRKLEVTERGIALDVEDKVLSRGKRRNTCCKNHSHTWLWAERKRGLKIGREERLASTEKITTIQFFKKNKWHNNHHWREKSYYEKKSDNKMKKFYQQLF